MFVNCVHVYLLRVHACIQIRPAGYGCSIVMCFMMGSTASLLQTLVCKVSYVNIAHSANSTKLFSAFNSFTK